MRMFLISDNTDTYTGMQLAGIDGVVVHEREEVEKEIDKALSDKNIGIIIITEKLRRLVNERVTEIINKFSQPLIIEIPDRHGNRSKNSMSDMIISSIGLKI